MKGKYFRAAAIFYFLFSVSLFTTAQQTAVYTDANADYKKGVELFNQEKYGAAKKQFADFIAETKNESKEDELMLMNAYYYQAVCARELDEPEAEKLFLDLTNNFEENPTTRLAYYQLGNIYYQQKKYDKEIEFYSKVNEYDLSDDELAEYKFQLGYAYFVKNKFQQAKPYFASVKDVDNKYYFQANYYYGFISYTDKHYEDALTSFTRISNSLLYKDVAPYYQMQILYLQKKYTDVIKISENQNDLIISPSLKYKNEMQQLLGKSYFNLKEYDKALPLLTVYYNSLNKTVYSDIYQIAYCQYKTADFVDAINNFKQLNVLKDSVGQNSLFLLGDCYLKTNEKEKARNAFGEAAKMNFDKFIQENASYNYAKLNYDLGFQDVAVTSLQSFLTQFPKSTYADEVREDLTQLFLSTNNYKDALTVIANVSNKTPAMKKAYQRVAYARGVQLYNDTANGKAIKLFDESLLNPIDEDITALCYFYKGDCYYRIGNYKQANTELFKFIDAAKQAKNLPPEASPMMANYTIGYCFLKQVGKDSTYFLKAQTYFDNAKLLLAQTNFSAEQKQMHDELLSDIYLRNADCNFILKNYGKAISDYSKVIDENFSSADYALFQKGIIQGLQKNYDGKISSLKKLMGNFPKSVYFDDALYETGNTLLNTDKTAEAENYFSKIISDYKNSNHLLDAYMQLGQCYVNTNDNANAMVQYKFVVTNYCKTKQGQEALDAVRVNYIAAGDAQGYLDFLAASPCGEISHNGQDSITYQAAETIFQGGDCANSENKFTDYLKNFPAGFFILNAHFYRAECFLKDKKYDDAVADYEYVANKGVNIFSERSVLLAARINYTSLKNYSKAYTFYEKLSHIASLKENIFEAQQGMMYCGYFINNYSNARTAANAVLASTEARDEDKTEAHYYLAKMNLSENKLDDAYADFSLVKSKSKTEIGAEARYSLAEIIFKKGLLDSTLNVCQVVLNEIPQDYGYWIAKTYLLTAEVFEAQQDYFQAKATLQSIIDNFGGSDEIIKAAIAELDEVKAKEASNSKLIPDNGTMPSDTLQNK